MTIKRTYFVLSLIVLIAFAAAAEQIMTSPDQNIKLTLTLDQNYPQISVSYKDTGIISEFGFCLAGFDD